MKMRAETRRLLVVTEDQWGALKQNWTYVSQRTRLWHWKLDSALPGRLGQIGDWLYRSEETLEADSHMTEEPSTSPADVRRKIDEYKVTRFVIINCSCTHGLFHSAVVAYFETVTANR